MKRAFIIHGYGATPEDHWFSWLAQQLQAAGVATAIPALPDPEQPDFDRWQAALATHDFAAAFLERGATGTNRRNIPRLRI